MSYCECVSMMRSRLQWSALVNVAALLVVATSPSLRAMFLSPSTQPLVFVGVFVPMLGVFAVFLFLANPGWWPLCGATVCTMVVCELVAVVAYLSAGGSLTPAILNFAFQYAPVLLLMLPKVGWPSLVSGSSAALGCGFVCSWQGC